jgi:hypothetical protein
MGMKPNPLVQSSKRLGRVTGSIQVEGAVAL